MICYGEKSIENKDEKNFIKEIIYLNLSKKVSLTRYSFSSFYSIIHIVLLHYFLFKSE